MTVWCALDKDICKPPQSVNAVATGMFGHLDEDAAETSLTITFDQATNMPDVGSVEGVNDVITFSETSEASTGKWLDERTLKITVVNATGASPRIDSQ